MTYSIIQKSKLEGARRLDAEYYQPEFLEWDNKIKSGRYSTFGELIRILTDYTANGSFTGLKNNVNITDDPDFAKWIRIQNLDNNNFRNSIRYIDEKSYNFLKKSSLHGKEILISKTGEYLGKAYLMPKIKEKTTLADNIFLIHLKDASLNEFIITFINSSIGRRLLLRRLQGTGQPTIIKDSLRSFLIPMPDNKTKKEITKYFKNYTSLLALSDNLYSQAETLLLDELKIKDLDLEDKLSYVVNLSEAEKQKREDAEYFQPKYRKLIEHIRKNCNGVELGELVCIKKGIEPGAESYRDDGKPAFAPTASELWRGKQFIRVSSMSKYGINDNDQKYLSEDLYNELKEKYEPKKGEILLTKDASLGIAYVLKKHIDGIISGGILRLKLKNKKIEDEYLALCLNSIIGQMHAERDAGGSIIKHWKPDQIKKVIIPLLPKQTQQKISSLIRESFKKRIKAKELLKEAKEKVEEEIEKK